MARQQGNKETVVADWYGLVWWMEVDAWGESERCELQKRE